MSLLKKWVIEDEKNINKNISTHKLYNENVSEKIFVSNANTFSFKKVLLSNKWKYILASLSGIIKYIKYSVSFTSKKKVTRFDYSYEQFVIIFKNDVKMYAICYGNVHLADDHLRAKKDFERSFNNASTSKKKILLIMIKLCRLN